MISSPPAEFQAHLAAARGSGLGPGGWHSAGLFQSRGEGRGNTAPSFAVPGQRPRYLGIEGELVRDRVWQVAGFRLGLDRQVIFNRSNLAALACRAGNQVNEVQALWVLPHASWAKAPLRALE